MSQASIGIRLRRRRQTCERAQDAQPWKTCCRVDVSAWMRILRPPPPRSEVTRSLSQRVHTYSIKWPFFWRQQRERYRVHFHVSWFLVHTRPAIEKLRPPSPQPPAHLPSAICHLPPATRDQRLDSHLEGSTALSSVRPALNLPSGAPLIVLRNDLHLDNHATSVLALVLVHLRRRVLLWARCRAVSPCVRLHALLRRDRLPAGPLLRLHPPRGHPPALQRPSTTPTHYVYYLCHHFYYSRVRQRSPEPAAPLQASGCPCPPPLLQAG